MTDAQTIAHNLGGHWKNGRGQAPCPICQPEGRKDQTALSIAESNGKLLLFCFKSGCSFVEISRAVGLPLEIVQIDFDACCDAKKKQADYTAKQAAKARSLWDFAKPIQGSKAEAYLRARGITADLPKTLRFVPDLYHAPSASWACAMVAKVNRGNGVHRTFFDKKGQRLSKNAKMMLGPCAGRAVALSEARGPMVVCEGIETGLSLLSGFLSGPATVWAALSTSGIKALNLPEKAGEIIIATDGDEPGQEAGNALAQTADALGWKVSLMPAPDGMDWNDVLQSGVAV